jgi:hypothetical protein
MKRVVLSVAILTSVSLALGQRPVTDSASRDYRPAVPPPSVGVYGGGVGYGYGGAGSTVAGSAMTGMANVISAKGNYNLSTSAAAVNLTQAQSNEIQNRQQYTNTYFEMRATNKAATAAERGPRLTPEQIARNTQARAPKPISPDQVDPVSGKVNWPDLLQNERYAPQRAELEQLLFKQASYGGLGAADNTKAREAVESMSEMMKDQIREVPAQQYTAAKSFLKSLMYSMTKTQLS